MMKHVDLNYFPGWTRKAITFTMDDGNVTYDRIFIEMVKPYGLGGAFNLSSHNITKHNDPEGMRALYRGFEITNHVRLHPYAFYDGDEVDPARITEETFHEETADKTKLYRMPDAPDGAFYRYSEARSRWEKAATAKAYITLVDECRREMEAIFGEGSVRGFVWSFHRQENTEVIEYLKSQYYGLRTAGGRFCMDDMEFALPADRSNWIYNARHSNLLERAAQFEALPDNGELKWFAFGVHPIDFERDGKWEDLRTFCEMYGNRPEDYWYASNIDIFEYEDAVRGAVVSESTVTNPSEITLYIKVDGRRITLAPHSSVNI